MLHQSGGGPKSNLQADRYLRSSEVPIRLAVEAVQKGERSRELIDTGDVGLATKGQLCSIKT